MQPSVETEVAATSQGFCPHKYETSPQLPSINLLKQSLMMLTGETANTMLVPQSNDRSYNQYTKWYELHLGLLELYA